MSVIKRSWYTIVASPICRSIASCGKTADWIRMRFGVVSAVGRGMGVLDGVEIAQWEGAILGVNVGLTIVTSEDFVE